MFPVACYSYEVRENRSAVLEAEGLNTHTHIYPFYIYFFFVCVSRSAIDISVLFFPSVKFACRMIKKM